MRAVRSALALIGLVSLLACAGSAAATEPQVFFTTLDGNGIGGYWGSVNRVDASGGAAANSPTVIGTGNNSMPAGIAFDPTHGRLIWADIYCGCLGTSRLDLSDVRRFRIDGESAGMARAVAVDPDGGRVYWVDASDRIRWADLDESGAQGVLDTGTAPISFAEGIAFDPVSRRVYWSNWPWSDSLSGIDPDFPVIGWASVTPGGGAGGFGGGLGLPTGMVGLSIDHARGRIFLADYDGGDVNWISLDGSDTGTVDATGATSAGPRGSFFDALSDGVFWSNLSDAAHPLGYSAAGGDGPASDVSVTNLPAGEYPNGNPLVVPPTAAWVAPTAGLQFSLPPGQSQSKTIEVRSTAFDPIDVESISLDGPDAGMFSLPQNCIGQLAGGETCAIPVTTAAGATLGRFTASLKVATTEGDFERPLATTVVPPGPDLTADVALPVRCTSAKLRKRPKLSFSVPRASTVRVRLERRVSKRKAPSRCPRAGARTGREARRGRVRSAEFVAAGGTNSVDILRLFKLRTASLAPGHYRLSISTRNQYGETSPETVVFFWVLRRQEAT